MLAVVWTNPNPIARSRRLVERCAIDSSQLIVVGGKDIRAVHERQDKFEWSAFDTLFSFVVSEFSSKGRKRTGDQRSR